MRIATPRRSAVFAAVAAGAVVAPPLPVSGAFPPTSDGGGCNYDALVPETDIEVWFDDSEGTWEAGLKSRALSRLEEWMEVWDPGGGRYVAAVTEGSSESYNVRFVLGGIQGVAAVLCGEERGGAILHERFNAPSSQSGVEEIWLNGAAALAHELGHSFLLGHTGTPASGGSAAAPPVMNTCPIGVDEDEFSHLHVSHDDHAALVNRSWAMEDRALYDASAFAGANPGFEAGARFWKSSSSVVLAGSGGPITSPYNGDLFMGLEPLQSGNWIASADPVTVNPEVGNDWLGLAFRGAIADYDGATTSGGRFGYQISWRKLAYETEFPEDSACGVETWMSGLWENEVDFASEWLTPGVGWRWGWNDQSGDWTEIEASPVTTFVPSGAWDAVEVGVSLGTEADSSTPTDTPGVALDDVGVALLYYPITS